ncbi:MAG: AAA family ATPase [Candidatus Pacebacteria bacterium]|nr:AAA family ATPase [Candidatus Paceibacterota bacterium]
MANAEQLVSLVRSGVTGDKEALQKIVESIVADANSKSHHILADRLKRALAAPPQPSLTTSRIMGNDQAGRQLIHEIEPRRQLSDLLLPEAAQEEARNLIEEQQRADVLRAHGIEPRHRILLSGPPGNGKTSFAEAIAESLAIPFYVVRYDALIGSYLGETNARLRKLFDYIKTIRCVLFFDEFDAVGKERGDDHETGEIKRVVSFLLMQIDHLPSYVVIMAATNHAELLDRAVWRRFQQRILFPAPTEAQIAVYLDRVFSNWEEAKGANPKDIAHRLQARSYAEALDFCQTVKRRHILSFSQITFKDIVKNELYLSQQSVKPEVDSIIIRNY